MIDGLRVTSPERTIGDIAATSLPWIAEDAAEAAIYKGQTTADRLLARIRGRPGTADEARVRRPGVPMRAPGLYSVPLGRFTP